MNFENDFMDGLIFASLLAAYTPYVVSTLSAVIFIYLIQYHKLPINSRIGIRKVYSYPTRISALILKFLSGVHLERASLHIR